MGAVPRLDVAGAEQGKDPDSAWWGIHVARYAFAAGRLGRGRVLDIACGTGYGMEILAAPERTVVGADIELDTLGSALRVAPVAACDGACLPFSSGAFDAVTTFETLEHLERRDEFLAELERVLTPGGSLVLSTPNAHYTRPMDGRPRNPFHVFEYTPDELEDALRVRFVDVSMVGQRIGDHFRISPFWDDQQRLPRTPRVRARLAVWRLLNKLPRRPRDTLSRQLWGHPLYPGADDYAFTPEAVATAPVLVVTAKRRSSSDSGNGQSLPASAKRRRAAGRAGSATARGSRST